MTQAASAVTLLTPSVPHGYLVDCLSFSDSTNAVRRVGVGPAKGATGFVVGPDVLHQLASQIGGRGEDAAREAVALDLGKPELDLIQPRAVRRRIVHRDARVRGEPCGDGLGLMRGEVVGDEMDRAAPRVGGHQLVQEGEELDTRMAGARAPPLMARSAPPRGPQRRRPGAARIAGPPPPAAPPAS